MASNKEYITSQPLGTGAISALFRGRDSDGQSILLKFALSRPPSREEIHLFRNDLDFSQRLGSKSTRVLRAKKMEIRDESMVLFLEDFGGVQLASTLGSPMPVSRFLDLAIRIVQALQDIHDSGVTHNLLNPRSIFLDPNTSEVKIGDFTLATLSYREDRAFVLSDLLGKEYAYISPEQTARTSRVVDYRTDFYSLGVVFFQMLAGKLPFSAEDALGWFHLHMTFVPSLLSELRPEVPAPLAEIVAKLMKKMAEERYQSAGGLLHDLEKCREELLSHGSIRPFPLGSRDKALLLSPPDKLYGRDGEMSSLRQDFVNATQGGTVFTFISGYSGVGKSSLVRELEKEISCGNGMLVTGKFDLRGRNAPYFTITSALREIIVELLSEDEAELAAWRARIKEEIGDNAALLANLVPELALLIDSKLPRLSAEEISPAETEQRLLHGLRSFLGLIAGRKRPLTLFLDDLQWSDPATLKVLEHLASSPELRYFFLIGSFRDNEVGPHHPLALTLERIKAAGPPLREIKLAPIAQPEVRSLIAGTLHEEPAQVASLADHIFTKTGGNPFFVLQFLKSIYAEGLLRVDTKSGHWCWENDQIDAAGYTDSAIDLMVKIISNLPLRVQEVLALAALKGGRFTPALLGTVSGLGEDAAREALETARRDRLVLKTKDAYAFQHDKIQQAAYSLTPVSQRARVHLELARALRSEAGSAELANRVFEIASQFNSGLAEISSPTERMEVASLNLLAGKKAKAAAAHAAAIDFLSAGISLLPPEAWATDFDLFFDILLEAAECSYLVGRFDEATRMLEDLVAHARSPVEKARAFAVWLSLHTTTGEMTKAISVGLEALRVLGWDFPRNPTAEQVAESTQAIWDTLRGREIENLIDLPLLTNERMLISLKILGCMILPAHFAGSSFGQYATVQMILISIQHGITADSLLAFSWFAASLVDRRVGRYAHGYRFGKVAYDLMKKHSYTSCKSKVCLFFGDIVHFYTKHIRTDRPFILESFEAGVAYGDLPSACYCCNHIVTNMLASADPLDQTWQESERSLAFVQRAKDPNIESIILAQQRFILSMQGKTSNPYTFSDEKFREEEFEEHIQKLEMTLMKFWYYILKMQSRFLYGDYSTAAEAEAQAERLSDSDHFDVESTQYFFYSALTLAAHYDEVAPEKKNEYLDKILARLVQLRAWAESCPETFENRFLLVSAEMARLTGDTAGALRLYESAIRSAEQNGFAHNMAIASELASRFHHSLGLEVSAEAYRNKALLGYQRWGADGKVAQLKKQALGTETLAAGEKPAAETGSFSSRVDLNAALKAQRAISGELDPEILYQTILRIALENAGAQRGALVLVRDGSLTVQVELDRETAVSESVALESAVSLPKSIIHFVSRLKTKVLIHDATAPNSFSADEYLLKRRPRSILCLPVIRQSELKAIIYLENNLTTHSFTAESQAVLEMLAAQAAISIENSFLYDDLRKSVRARDEFMAIASHELKSPLSSASIYVQTLRQIIRKGELARYPEANLLKLLDSSNNSIKHLSFLIDQLLDVSRFTLGTLTIHREPVMLADIIRGTLERYERDLHNANCRVSVELEPGISGNWDPLRLEQIFNNLVSNAIKYAAGKPITIRAARKGGSAVFSVEDEGMGISEGDRKRLFRPFERAVPYRSISGFGLGLFIVKKVVESHEGRLNLESEPGKGTKFTIELPLALEHSPEERNATP